MQPCAFLIESQNLQIVVEVMIGKQKVGQVVVERFRGERVNVGILDAPSLLRQKSHAMLSAAPHGARRKQRFYGGGLHPQAGLRSKLPQGTDFIVA